MKDYLEPRDLYDSSILSEEGDSLIYSMEKLILSYQQLLRDDNEVSDAPLSEDEIKRQSIEWLEHRVLPLQGDLAVEFEDDLDFRV
jgi:hypothetical protein